MNNIVFKPWVGAEYHKQNTKIFILGESHYIENFDSTNLESLESFTNEIVSSYIEYKNDKTSFEPWMNTFTKFTNVFFNQIVDLDVVNNFWNSIVFYNFVQKPISGPRISPTQEDFENSVDAFFEVLKCFKPDVILVWGVRLWEQTPNLMGAWYHTTLREEKVWYYEIDGKKIPAFGIYDPSSSAFNYNLSDYLKNIIDWVKTGEVPNII